MTEISPTTTATTTDPAQTAIANVIAQVTSKLGITQANALAPVISQYGPAFAAMSAAEIWSWINLATQGDEFAAYQAVLQKMSNADLISQWTAISAKWQTANATNAATVAWQRSAVSALLSAFVQIAASLVAL